MVPKVTNEPQNLEVWWIRHSCTDWNDVKRWQGYTDVHLNAHGRELARRLNATLGRVHFDSVWSSDLSRCLETAQLALPGVHIRTDKRLREIPMGIAEGKTWDELSASEQEQISNWWSDPYEVPFPGTDESLNFVLGRVKAWLSEQPAHGRIACFSHGGVIRALMWDLTNVRSGAQSWMMELGNTGIVRVRYSEGRPKLLCFNDLSHLDAPWDLPPAQNVPGAK